MKRATAVPLAVIAALIAFAVWRCAQVWDGLPLRLASHFDAGGRPDGFMPRDAFFWVYGGLGGGTALLLLLAPVLTRALPARLINVPNGDYWLVPERRGEVQAKLAAFMCWSAAACIGLLVAVLELVLRANLEQRPLAPLPMWLLIGGYLLAAPLSLVWLVRAFRVPDRARSR